MRIKRFLEPSGSLDYAAIYKAANPGVDVPEIRTDLLRGIIDYSPADYMYAPWLVKGDNTSVLSPDMQRKWELSPFSGIEKTVGTAYIGADLLRGIGKAFNWLKGTTDYVLKRLALRAITSPVATSAEKSLGSDFMLFAKLNATGKHKNPYEDIYALYLLNKDLPQYKKYEHIFDELPQLISAYRSRIPIEQLGLASRAPVKFTPNDNVLKFYVEDVYPRLLKYRSLADKRYQEVVRHPFRKTPMSEGYTLPNEGGYYSPKTRRIRIGEGTKDPELTAVHELRHATQYRAGVTENGINMSPVTLGILHDAYQFKPDGALDKALGPIEQLLEKLSTNTELRYLLWRKHQWKTIDEGNKVINNLSDGEILDMLGSLNDYGADFVSSHGSIITEQVNAIKLLLQNPGTDVSHIMDQRLAERIARQFKGQDPNNLSTALYILNEVEHWFDKALASKVRRALKQSPIWLTGIFGAKAAYDNENQSKEQDI